MKVLRLVVVILVASLLTGCVYWRLYQTKLQLAEFDKNFSIVIADDFTWIFKDSKLYSDDFTELSKLQPSRIITQKNQQTWRYQFHKVDDKEQLFLPEVNFFFDLNFNPQQQLTHWVLSPLFLKLAPPEFLAASLQSLGKGEINQSKRQLKVAADAMVKINAPLPQKSEIIKHLGEPLNIENHQGLQILHYLFKLETPKVETGYEYRTLSKVRLFIDPETEELVKMSGRFVGLKLSIDYRQYSRKK